MFRERLLQQKVLQSAQTPRPQYWFDVALGRTGIVLSNFLDTASGRVGVRVYLSHRIATAALSQLEKERHAIESEIGEPLLWNPTPDKLDKIIALYRTIDVDNRAAWPEYCDWLVTRVARFRQAFVPRVKALRLGEALDR